MKTRTNFWRPCNIVVIGLVLSCLTLSACKPWFLRTKRLFGEEGDKFPAVVLNTQGAGNHDYTFDWDKNTVGGVSMADFQPNKKYWRLNVFNLKDGAYLTPFKACKDLSNRTETFTNIAFDKLMRADLDVGDDPKCEENAETFSLIFLLHDDE